MHKNAIDPARADHYTARLQSLKDELTERRTRILRHNRDGVPSDSEEQAGARQNDDVVASLSVHVDEEIAQVNAALARIERGVYGICDHCGDTIADARLNALPYASQCSGCASHD